MPSIDLMGGKVVRLKKGEPSSAKIYSHDPVATALRWIEEGARLLHVVDLDAALGSGNNLGTIRRIIAVARARIQVGGGIRSVEGANSLLREGAERIVLGTMASKDSAGVEELLEAHGSDRIMVALDYSTGRVRVAGWREDAGMSLGEGMERFRGMGVRLFLLTAVDRDGMLTGPDLETLASACSLPEVGIYASGGVRELRDLEELRRMGMRGAILGTSLYEGNFTLREALKSLGGP